MREKIEISLKRRDNDEKKKKEKKMKKWQEEKRQIGGRIKMKSLKRDYKYRDE